MLDYQRQDGSWAYAWYGWGKGGFEFTLKADNDAQATVQAAWTLQMVKYRYPQWIEQH